LSKRYFSFIIYLSISAMIISCSDTYEKDDPFIQAELAWRQNRDERMRQNTSWLTIAGLYWLEEGTNSFGSDGDNDIILPAHSAPPFAGEFKLNNGEVTLIAADRANLFISSKAVRNKILESDINGNPDKIELGKLKFWIIKREDRYALRLRDLEAKRFKEYHGIDNYPPQKDYKVLANLIPYNEPKTEIILTIVGTEETYTIPGYLEFELFGRKMRLDPFVVKSDSTRFFLILKDETSGKTTYGAGRYMYPVIRSDGKVELNFNRAYNPPCAFTPYATCPLPPKQNIMNEAIEAGEKNYHKDH